MNSRIPDNLLSYPEQVAVKGTSKEDLVSALLEAESIRKGTTCNLYNARTLNDPELKIEEPVFCKETESDE